MQKGSFKSTRFAQGTPCSNNATYNPNVFTNVIIPPTKLDEFNKNKSLQMLVFHQLVF